MGICGTDFDLAEFRSVWPRVRERAKGWIAEDAIEAAEGRSTACLMNDDGMVAMKIAGRRAYVLLAVSTGTAGAFERNEAAVATMARDMGATVLAFRSDRRGWAKVLGPEWRHQGDLYERTL